MPVYVVESFATDHGVSDPEEVEAVCYYSGVRPSGGTPRLIYRTSRDVFPNCRSITSWTREITLFSVHDHAKLSENNMWDILRDETAGILDRNQIKWTSIDLVRFLWKHDPERTRGEGEPAPHTIGPPTVWIGVLPRTTNRTKACELSEEIMKIIRGKDINDVEVAFRESVARPFATRPKPALFAPVNNFHPLYKFIHCLNTALSLPIAAEDSLDIEATMGFYFKVGEDLYGVAARHVIFPTLEGNETYSDDTACHRKYICLMGRQTIESCRSAVLDDLDALRESLKEDPPAEQCKRERMKSQIDALCDFMNTLMGEYWLERTIGHVVWSPPICGLNCGDDGEGYTRDVCVIKLDKDKFLPNMVGNAIEIGSLEEMAKFSINIHPKDLGHDGMYHIKHILPVADITDSNVQDRYDHHTRHAVRSGPKPNTTIGLLNGFMSRVRHYTLFGSFDSIEMAMFSNNPVYGPFASPGDSGAVVVGSSNEFIAQLTSGTGGASSCEIVYGTPMEWLWNKVIKPQFPDAVLFFEARLRNVN